MAISRISTNHELRQAADATEFAKPDRLSNRDALTVAWFAGPKAEARRAIWSRTQLRTLAEEMVKSPVLFVLMQHSTSNADGEHGVEVGKKNVPPEQTNGKLAINARLADDARAGALKEALEMAVKGGPLERSFEWSVVSYGDGRDPRWLPSAPGSGQASNLAADSAPAPAATPKPRYTITAQGEQQNLAAILRVLTQTSLLIPESVSLSP